MQLGLCTVSVQISFRTFSGPICVVPSPKNLFSFYKLFENSTERSLNHFGVTFPLSENVPVSCHPPTTRLLNPDLRAAFLHSSPSQAYRPV